MLGILANRWDGIPPNGKPYNSSPHFYHAIFVCHGSDSAHLLSLRERRLVPVEGIEPPLLAEHDFESCASTSSATRACAAIYIRRAARSAKRKSGPELFYLVPPEGPEGGLDRLDSVSVRVDNLVKGGASRRRLWRSQTLDKIVNTNNWQPSDQGRHPISVKCIDRTGGLASASK